MSIVKSYSFPDGEIRGDMYYIKHGTNNFTVIDCYLKDGDDRNARREEIISEIKYESSGRTCRFILTHPDNDHIAGIEYLDDNWEILNFYAVDNRRPVDRNDSSLSRYHWLMANKNFPIKRGIKRAWLNDSNDENNSSGINFLWPDLNNEKFKRARQLKKLVNHYNKNELMKNDLYVRWADFLSVVVFSNISADSRGLRMLILVILLWIYFFTL